jgi:hypothetical protein
VRAGFVPVRFASGDVLGAGRVGGWEALLQALVDQGFLAILGLVEVLGQVVGFLTLGQRLDLAAGGGVLGLERFLDVGFGDPDLAQVRLGEVREPSCGAMLSAISNVLGLAINGSARLRVPWRREII